MSDATDVPILLDADTGFGNFNNARRLVQKLEKIGVAGSSSDQIFFLANNFSTADRRLLNFMSHFVGCCMEDKLFPKTNSLLDGRPQELAKIEEFSLKIKVIITNTNKPNVKTNSF